MVDTTSNYKLAGEVNISVGWNKFNNMQILQRSKRDNQFSKTRFLFDVSLFGAVNI